MHDVPPHRLLDRRLLLFTGKGGVGKSTVVAALALEAARRGRNPLVVELGHRATMATVFEVDSVGYAPQQVGRGVWACNLEFERTLADYMTEHVRVPRLARTILANDALSRFFAAAPAVGEIATLNKLSALAAEREGSGPRWDPVLVDLDATGHALMLLNLPNVMNGLVGEGPLRRLLDGFSALLTDPARTVLNLVTLPNELPAQETVELYARLRDEHEVPVGALFVNQVPKLPIADDLFELLDPLQDRAEAVLGKPGPAGVIGAEVVAQIELTRRMLLMRARAQGQVDRLREEVPLPLVEIEQMATAHLSVDHIAAIGRAAVEALEAHRG